MFYDFMWKKSFAPGNGEGGWRPPPCPPLSTTLENFVMINFHLINSCNEEKNIH